ncbi:hypothetical protein SAMN04489729_4966 [Amycolatopsis lurida]|nr:hypothetical protein SAMN04489729_4966 [Amycolatopsis lurida]
MTRLPLVRFPSPTRDERGNFTGGFGLVNGFARAGRLTVEQEPFRRTNNERVDGCLAVLVPCETRTSTRSSSCPEKEKED